VFLAGLDLVRERATQREAVELVDRAGAPLELAGRRLSLPFAQPQAPRELLRAELRTRDGRTIKLLEGDSFEP
jgi:hypothetical protein